jgi:hypothetical protein
VKTVNLESLEFLLTFAKGIFIVTIRNLGADTVRIWEKTFLYGYYLFSLRIRKVDEAEPTLIISRKKIRWTVNVPAYFLLEPGTEKPVELDLNDGTWDLTEVAETESDSPVYVSVEMRIDQNEFTDEYEITTGRAVSNEILFEGYSALLSSTR